MKLILLFFLVPAIMICISTFNFVTRIEKIQIKGFDNLTANIMSKFDTFGAILPVNVRISRFFVLVLVVWTLGFILFYLFNLLRDIYVLKRLTLISKINEDDKLEMIKQSVVTSLGIKKAIPIYRNNVIEQPFISGIINAKIFLPDIEVSDNVWQLIIRHELIHYKSKDIFFKRIAMFIQGIHWFNPFIYLFCQYFYDVSEISCDEKLLYEENKTVRSEYAHAILNLLNTGKVLKGISGFYSDNVTSLERRLYYIMNKNTKPKKVLMVFLSLVTIAICPLSAYASTLGAATVQDVIIKEISKKSETEEPFLQIETNIEHTIEHTEDYNSKLLIEQSGYSVTRGANLIDSTLNGTRRLVVDSVNLSKGSNVQFILAAANTSDKFRAGIIDESGDIRYVNSSSGTISHSFSISKAGSYQFFIEGTTSSNIHITGSITL